MFKKPYFGDILGELTWI